MKTRLLLGFAAFCTSALFTLTVGAAIVDCKPAQTPGLIEAGAPVAGDACTKLSAFDSSGTLQEICTFLPDILAAAAIIVPAVMVSKGETCEVLAGTDRCFTNAQRLQMINHLRGKDAGK